MDSKLIEVEAIAKGIFMGDFIGLAETCHLFGKDLKENEDIKISRPFTENWLKMEAGDSFFFFSIPRQVRLADVLALTKIFDFTLGKREVICLKMKEIKAGAYLIRKDPRHLSSGAMLMRNSGMKVEKEASVAELLYFLAVCHLTGRKLLRRLCTLCRDEVDRRGSEMPVCVETNHTNDGFSVGAWRSSMLMPNIVPVRRL